MNKIKLTLNNILNKIGYRIIRVDKSEKNYRDILKTFIIKNKDYIKGDVLEIGAAKWSWPKKEFANKCSFIALDQTKDENVDIVGNIENLSVYLKNKKFDTILCFEVLEHIKKINKAVEEIYQNLKNEGVLIASVPFNHEVHGESYGDYWRFTRQGLRELLKEFNKVEITGIGRKELNPHHYLIIAKKCAE